MEEGNALASGENNLAVEVYAGADEYDACSRAIDLTRLAILRYEFSPYAIPIF